MRRCRPEPNPWQREVPSLWSVPYLWEGQTAAIFGGGPSLNALDVAEVIRRGWRRIACNDAFRLDPRADILCWGDAGWYDDNSHEIRRHRGLKVTWATRAVYVSYRAHRLEVTNANRGLSKDPSRVVATNTGQGAINLAFLLGVSRIVLFGFDMRTVNGRHNWHGIERTAEERLYEDVFIPALDATAKVLQKSGVEVINCTPNSALKAFPIIPCL